jgi:hypothetical protein
MTSLILIALLTVNPIAACLLDLDSEYMTTDHNSMSIDKITNSYSYGSRIRKDYKLLTQSKLNTLFENSYAITLEKLNKISTFSILNSFVKTSIFF